MPAVLLLAGCGYYKRSDTGTSSTSSAGAARTASEDPVNLTGVWTLSITGCDVGPDAWSKLVEVEHQADEIVMRFTYYQEVVILLGLVTGQKIRADRAVEENDGTLTWILFEGDYHSDGSIIAGEFTGRDGVTCTLVLKR